MTFTIDSVYKAGIPRGEFYRSDLHSLNTSTAPDLEVSPTTTPEWAMLIDKVKFQEASFATAGAGTGVLEIQYPDYVGESVNTYTFSSLTALKHAADEVQVYNSETYYVWKPQPPILLRASKTYNTLTMGLPDNVTISAGNLDFLLTGWQLKESDFD